MYNKNNVDSLDFETYLQSKGVHICKVKGAEITAHCCFCGGDHDSSDNEGHLSLNSEKGVYNCFKCGAKGNKTTLAQHFGDYERSSWLDGRAETLSKPSKTPSKATQDAKTSTRAPLFKNLENAAKKYHSRLSKENLDYLHKRGLTDTTIETAQLGEGVFYGKRHITIPVKGLGGETEFLKLRQLPQGETGARYINWSPTGKNEATLYGGYELRESRKEVALITEGEFDALIAKQNGLPMAVSSTAGASTFKEEWLSCFRNVRTLYVCLDNDEKGEAGAKKIVEMFSARRPDLTIFKVRYPDGVKDMTDYFVGGNSAEDLLKLHSQHVAGPAPVDPTEFKEMTLDDLKSVLDETIKYDDINKCLLFLAMLTAYTESDQLNVYIVGPSSNGKTYLMQQVAAFFPAEDKEVIAGASPTAFKHRTPVVDPETGEKYVDLERKLLLFQDTPHFQLAEVLRPLLSHDEKEIVYYTTDRSKDADHTSKKSVLRGFPVFVACSASNRMDEQEATRALIISPEASDEKVRAGFELTNLKTSNPEAYKKQLEQSKSRRLLMERVRYIKNLHISSVVIPDPEMSKCGFETLTDKLQPRSQRDIAHFNSLVKAAAMLNAPFRLIGGRVHANCDDVEMAKELWRPLAQSVELGISPSLRNFYYEYIMPAYKTAKLSEGTSRTEIRKVYYDKTHETLNDDKLRKDYIPALRDAGLIEEVKSPSDKKIKLIVPCIDVDVDVEAKQLAEAEEIKQAEDHQEYMTHLYAEAEKNKLSSEDAADFEAAFGHK